MKVIEIIINIHIFKIYFLMKVLRITRTFPSKKFPNVGLQTFILSKYSTYKSIIFVKKSKNKLLKNPKFYLNEISFSEYSLSKKNYSLIEFLLSLITKTLANLKFFMIISIKVDFKKILLIHIHNLNFIFVGFLLKVIFKKKLFLSLGGTDNLRLKNKFLFKFLLKRIDKIFCVSFQIKNDLNNHYPYLKEKIFVTGNGVDTKFYKFKNIKKKNYLLAIGNIRWQKDYQTLIKAFSIVLEKYPFLILKIAGYNLEQNEYYKILETTKKCKLQKKVDFIGYKNQKNIRNLLYESKILILSSVSEGLPKVILESISCGTPIISSNVGDNKIILKKKGLIFKKKNYKELSLKILKLLDDKKMYKSFKKQCLKDKENFSWQSISEKILEHYKF